LADHQRALEKAQLDHGPLRELHSPFWRHHMSDLPGDFLTAVARVPPDNDE
jgi:hypothetical protein